MDVAEGDEWVPRAGLPDGIPDELRAFVRCEAAEVVLPAGKIDWIPKPKLGPIPLPDVAASVSFQVISPTEVAIIAKWSVVSLTLPASNRGGLLHIETRKVKGIGKSIKNWVDAVNADFSAHGRILVEVRMEGDDLYLRHADGCAEPQNKAKKAAALAAGSAIVAGGAAAAALRSARRAERGA